MDICRKCHKELPLSAFGRVTPRSGKRNPRHNYWCLICRSSYQKDQRRKAIDLLGGACVGCEEIRPGVLQIDHIDRVENQKNRPKTIQTVYAVLRGEPNHQLLCANCHSQKTQAEAAWELLLSSRG